MRRPGVFFLLFLVLTVSFLVKAGQVGSKELPLDAHMSEAYKDDLPELLKKKYIRVLTTVNRTNFSIYDGNLVGHEYSLLKGYEDFLNKQFRQRDLKVVLEFIPVRRDELIPRLVEGYGDIAAAGLTITADRQEKVAFTRPYLTGIDEVVVIRKYGLKLSSVSDLSVERVYVRQSSSYYQSLKELNTRLRKERKKPVKIIGMGEEIETESLLEMVNSGSIPVTVADSHIAKAWAQVLKTIEVHETVTLRRNGEIAWIKIDGSGTSSWLPFGSSDRKQSATSAISTSTMCCIEPSWNRDPGEALTSVSHGLDIPGVSYESMKRTLPVRRLGAMPAVFWQNFNTQRILP